MSTTSDARGDLDHGAPEVLRRPRRPRRHRPVGAGGFGLRTAGTERRRQDDDGPDPLHAEPADAGTALVGGHDVATSRTGPRGHRRHRAVLRRRQPAHRRGEPAAHGRSAAPRRDEGRRRIADLLDRFDLAEAAESPSPPTPGHAPQARPRHGPDELLAPHRLPRRADHRPGPAQPPDHVEIVRGLVADGATIFLTTQYLDEADQLADRIGVLDGGRLVAEGTAEPSSSGLVPGGHAPPHVPRPAGLESAAAALTGAATAPETPDPGRPQRRQPGLAPVRAAHARRRRSTPSTWPSTPPTSTTSSSPSPAPSDAPAEIRHDLAHLPTPRRLRDDAAAQPAPRGPLPLADRDRGRDARRVPAAVRVRLRGHARRGARRRGRGTRGVRQLRDPRHPDHRGRQRGPGDGDRRRHGHERGDHRAVPHHVDRPGLGARRVTC